MEKCMDKEFYKMKKVEYMKASLKMDVNMDLVKQFKLGWK